MTLVPASHRRRTARRSSSTSPPHTPCAPTPNACRSESSRQSGRTGQRAQTAMACAAWSRALATSRVTGNQSSGSTREPAHRAGTPGRPEHRSVLLTDPASAPWLVRVALAAGDREQAARIVTAIGEVARGNPTLVFIRASAEHAEGLLASDVSLLQHAATQLPDPWARACAVEDQGVLLAAAGRDREAIRSLEEALREYDRLGARRGVARTRRRLRQLGVRRRHWASEQRPAAGWASLTDIEQATARLVAEGLTNQRIADQLFISTHTVAFHLRQVFRKLDIRSRRPGPDRAGARAARGGANPMTGGCEAARVTARLTSC